VIVLFAEIGGSAHRREQHLAVMRGSSVATLPSRGAVEGGDVRGRPAIWSRTDWPGERISTAMSGGMVMRSGISPCSSSGMRSQVNAITSGTYDRPA